ncbi:MAG: thiamine pyrophosphate-binding protein [Euryarchaeota archaeon]|nr:thiamine pyrophosphate-binding protein [Euryarchaeota archaeon]
MKVARALCDALFSWGAKEMFGNPGTTELPFLEDIPQRYLLTLQDGIAMGAADGLAQVDSRPSLVNLHAAPGLGNAMGYLDSAYRNRSPVIVTVGQQDQRHFDQHPLLFGDFPNWVTGRVKWAAEVTKVAEAGSILRRAWTTATTPPWGPVLVSLPMNLMEEPWEGTPVPAPDPVPEGDATPSSLSEIVSALDRSTKPAIVAGYEVDAFDAFDDLANLSRKLGAPVVAEPLTSRSPVPSGLGSYVGDLLPASVMINQVLAPYDTVLLAGADLIVYPYFPAEILAGKTVLYVGTDPSVAGKLASHSCVGNPRMILKRVAAGVRDRGKEYRHPRDFARANRIARARPNMGGEFVLDLVRKVFPEHTVVDEAISNTPLLKATGFYRGKDSYFGYRSGQLGWALAASLGIGLRREKTLVVIGDGALMYAPQALWTLARYRIPVKVLVLNNHGYAILRSYSKAYHPPLTDAESLQIPNLDVVGLAKALGLPARSVGGPGELEGALEELRDTSGPSLLNVEIDPRVPDLFS